MKRNVLIFFFALLLNACTKTSNTTEVFIRIENATDEDFSNFTFMGVDFGSIAKNDTTGYLQFKNVLPVPFANDIKINDNYLYIEDIVPSPFLPTGKYLLQVIDDPTLRFKASFIKE